MNEQPVIFELIDQHIALVTLNRPEKRNAINGAVTRALEAAVQEVERNPAIRVAILQSSGEQIFSAGADLSEVMAGRGRELTTEAGGFAGFVKAERRKPWIAAVRGAAVGGGFELVLACDMVVAGSSASFGLPEAKRGVLAGAGGVFRLARSIPRAIALELLATGRSIEAQYGHTLGLVNRVVADADVLAEALRLAHEITANAPLSVLESLTIARVAHEHTEAELWQMSQAAAQRIIASADAKEGPRAFLEKRAPQWSGS